MSLNVEDFERTNPNSYYENQYMVVNSVKT